MQKTFLRNFVVLLLLLCVPVNTFAKLYYDTLTASVPVTFLEPSRGTKSCTAVMETFNDAPAPVADTLEFDSGGTQEFKIDINEPGTYRYKVYQLPGNDAETTYDDTVYTVVVFVTTDGSAALKYAVTATASDTGRKPDVIEFENHTEDEDNGGGSGGGSGTSGGRERHGSSSPLTPKQPTTSEPATEGTSQSVTEEHSQNVTEENTDQENTEKENITEQNEEPTTDKQYGMTSDADGVGGSGIYSDNDDNNDNDPAHKTDADITTDTAVNTGDSSRQSLWLALMCASLAVIVVTVAAEKFDKRKKAQS